MKVGRRLYFEKATGNIIDDTGERSGAVVSTTVDQDFLARPALAGRTLDSTDYLELEYGERQEEIKIMGSWEVNPVTKELVIYPQLGIAADKQEIAADNTEVAVITATLPGGETGETVYFSRDGGQEYPQQTVDGQASIEFVTEVPGEYTLSARHMKYGFNQIAVKGV